MNSVTHTEPRSSVCSSPKHCRNRPPRRRLVTRHRCHFVKQRLRLATQTTIELVRIERTASAKSPPKPVGNAALAEERHRWSVVHTESHSSVCSLPKHCRNRPPRSWFVIRHRCHFVKRRLCLATQTTIELARIERTASAKAPRRPVGNATLAEERHRWSGAARRGGRATTSAVLVR